MDQRIRAPRRQSVARPEPFLKFLKPGALARLRDSKISARSQRVSSTHRMSPPSSPLPPAEGQPQGNVADGFPCFSGRVYGYGPRCPKRKKLVAAKAVMLLSSTQSGPVSDLPDPVIDVFGSSDNIVAAH